MSTKKLKIKFPHISPLWCFLLTILFIRIFLYYQFLPRFSDGTKLRLTGKILSEPTKYDYSQKIKIQNYTVFLPSYPEVIYGDEVVVEGFVRAGTLEKAVLAKIEPRGGGIFGLRKKITDFYIKNLPQPHSALIAGMVLGSKSDLQQSFWEKLKYTGLAHVVVASGTNVSLVASFLINSFILFVKRKKAIFLTTLGIIFYVVLSGFDAPIVRAAIMAGLAFAAQLKGRLNQGLRTLFITAIVMLFISPSWVNDLGFLLSFVSTLCLIVFEPGLRRFLTWVPNLFREGFATSLAAQVGVAPILYFAFGRVNILSPLINALVLWTTPMIMVTGMVAGLIGIIIEPIGKLILYLGFPLTSWFVFVVDLFS